MEGPARQVGPQRWRRGPKDKIPFDVYVNGFVIRGPNLTAYWLAKSARLEGIADNLHNQHVLMVRSLNGSERTWTLCGKELQEYTAYIRREVGG